MQEMFSESWLTLGQKFAKGCQSGHDVILTLEFGDGVEDWSLQGGSDSHRKEFTALSRQAGEALYAVHLVDHETGSKVAPEVRWYRLLREKNAQEVAQPLVIDSAGVAVSSWSLPDAVIRSEELCAQLERTNPLASSKSWLHKQITEDPIGITFKAIAAVVLGYLLIRLGLR